MSNRRRQMRSSVDPLQRRLMYDRETGLPRWPLLLDRTEIALARARRAHRAVAVIVLDDPRTFSGAVPDLAKIGEKLVSRVRPDDTVARAAPRTFVVVCSDIPEDGDAAAVTQRLLRSIDVVCSLGITLSQADDTPDTLLTRALDLARALDQAKYSLDEDPLIRGSA